MMKGEKTQFKPLPMIYNKFFIGLFALLVIILLLASCQSNLTENHYSIEYNDAESSKKVIEALDAHYLVWRNAPYQYGGNSLNGVDCSAFTMNFFRDYFNTSIPRMTSSQAQIGKTVSQLKAGDLVFFRTGSGKNGLHVGIYYNKGLFLHASTSHGVIFSDLTQDYWQKHYLKA